MGIDENDYFFEISRLHGGIAMLDERIPSVSISIQRIAESDEAFEEMGREPGLLNLMTLRRTLSKGNVGFVSMIELRDSLVSRMREVYQMFADQEFESLSDLREDSALGGPAEQCAFAVTAVLDSLAKQFEEHVNRKNCTAELLLEFSNELGLPNQVNGEPEPPSGSGMVRLSEEIGAPCNGMRIGNDEIRIIDEAQTVTEFINHIAEVAIDHIRSALSSERSHALEHEIFSVSEEREYSYGEAVFPSKDGDDKR